MHIELSPKYEESLTKIINLLEIDASISDSFNAGGETIILAADREDLERILETDSADLVAPGSPEGFPRDIDEIKALLNEQLNEDI
ncbi:hypothetical protein [Pedobacter sp. SYSU D00535]|uniref:hypothetical protein n=1 Tax=Pedobacter sp. SYSU D00535 TaxID=2810308 RepID=UPI001A95BBB7|nr:hypothetical protein [Pedobacter sp. SYSU D00535]